MLLEIAVFNYASALLAFHSGADRIELCDNAAEGGTTQSYGVLKMVRQEIEIPVYPIIRPRGGDFLYTDGEFEVMKKDVLLCKDLGFEGVVFGILNPDGSVDKVRCMQLTELAYPMEVTFHRAFDRCLDPFEAMEDIIDMGCERILTSGQVPVASGNLPLIAELVKKADDRIVIMPGSGVRSNNIEQIVKETGAREFHSSARITVESHMKFINKRMDDADTSISVNESEIKAMKQILNRHANS
ncbi:MAG TPA: copper homeostasis protein CutC [Sphingobacteriaceae bacterium]